ncbi:MAG: Fe-S cluster assembly protein SufD [Muribaculaceae bacterium]|nr:Fe-S cluster assembly protein SufD [Muribaculaceae bacterium]
MSSLKQYIDLFKESRSTIEAHSTEVMNSLRDKAINSLISGKLPAKGDENYEITDLNETYAPDYGVNINRYDFGADTANAFRCDVPNMSTWLYFSFNDTYHSSRTASISMPDGVVIGSFNRLAKQYGKLISTYYGKLAPIENTQVALNTLLAQDGLFIYIPKNTSLEKPLQLVNILNATIPVMVNRRILIVLEENAHAKMLACDHTQSQETDFLNTQVIEVYAGKNSSFDFYDLEESGERTHRISSMWVRQEEGSNVLINGITLVNGHTRNDYSIDVVGENAETHLYGMAIAGNEQHIDNHTEINHNVGHCTSNELFKYILEDRSRGAFCGRIKVAPNAPRIEAYQGNRNICMSPEAKMYSKPQLEIYTDDVKCSHGSTIGQLDQDAIFYMQARGISKQEARMLLMQAFMADVISTVRMDSLKDRLRHLVDKRLYGKLALCQQCGSDCHDIVNNIEQ